MRAHIRYSRERLYNGGMEYCDAVICRVKGKKNQRRSLGKPTTEVMERINQINAERKLQRLITANFREGKDLYVTFTFDKWHYPKTRVACKRLTDNFLRRVKRYLAKKSAGASPRPTEGEDFKYIYVIEGDDGKRFHVHMVLSGLLTQAELFHLWGMAEIVNVKILQGSSTGFEALSVYLNKQGRIKGEHRWYGSRNLVQPACDEYNGKISEEDMNELGRAIEDVNAHKGEGFKTTEERYAPVESRYPGYYLAEASAVYLEEFREWFIHVKLYRKDTMSGKAETKRRKNEIKALERLRAWKEA